MKYVNVNEIAAKWNLSERSVRNYCTHGKIPGVILDGKTWRIPEDAVKPVRKKRAEKIANDLLTRLKMEKEAGIPGGIYHKVQIELTYNSNHMEGSRLTHDQTKEHIHQRRQRAERHDPLRAADHHLAGGTHPRDAQNSGGLQQPLHLLHHPQRARADSLPHGG